MPEGMAGKRLTTSFNIRLSLLFMYLPIILLCIIWDKSWRIIESNWRI